MNSDALGKSLSLNKPFTEQSLPLFFNALMNHLGSELLSRVINNGLLMSRRCLTAEQWSDVLQSFHSIQQSTDQCDTGKQMQSDEESKNVFRPFDNDNMPNAVVSEIFAYLDQKSHCKVECVSHQFCIVGRIPSSNRYFGDYFEKRLEYYENRFDCSALHLMRHLQLRKTISECYRFSKISKAVLEYDEDMNHSYWDAYPSLLSNVKQLAILNGDFDEWEYPTQNITNLKSLSLSSIPFNNVLSRIPANVLGNGSLQSLEMIVPWQNYDGMLEATEITQFIDWFVPKRDASKHFSNLKVLKLSRVDFDDFYGECDYILSDSERIANAYPRLIGFQYIPNVDENFGIQFGAAVLNRYAHRLESLHFGGESFGAVANHWNFLRLHSTDAENLENIAKSVPFSVKELCLDQNTLAVGTQMLSVAKSLRNRDSTFGIGDASIDSKSLLQKLEKISIHLSYLGECISKQSYNRISALFTALLNSQSKTKVFNFSVSTDYDSPTDVVTSLWNVPKIFTLLSSVVESSLKENVSRRDYESSNIVIRIGYHFPHSAAIQNSAIHQSILFNLINFLSLRFKNFQLSIQSASGKCRLDFDRMQQLKDALSLRHLARTHFQEISEEEVGPYASFCTKTRDWDFVECCDCKWITNCENCHSQSFFP